MASFSTEPLDLSGLTRVDYSRFSLRMNPFPALGIPEEVPAVTADRKDVMDSFRSRLRSTLFENKSSLLVLTGDFGAGKSHLLKYFKSRVNTQLLTSKKSALAVYVKSIGRDFKDLYLYFIDDIGRDFLSNYASAFIKTYMQKQGEAKMRKFLTSKDAFKANEPVTSDIERFLRNSRFEDLFDEIRESLESITNPDPIYALLHIAYPEYSSIAWRWFLGEQLTKEEKEIISVEDSIADQKDAQAIMQQILEIFTKSGISAVVLLIDEFEKFTLIPKLSRDRYMDDLRHFIDDNPHGTCLVLAVTPSAYVILNEVPSALTRRLSGQEKELNFFKPEDITELITRYLALGRIPDKAVTPEGAKLIGTTPDLYPFTEDAVKRIDKLSKGRVSTVVNLCRDSIEKAIETNNQLIDAETINEVSK